VTMTLATPPPLRPADGHAGRARGTAELDDVLEEAWVAPVGIGRVAEATGLSVDALRWYEREGLLPLVGRGGDGRRRYGPAAVRFVRLVQALRRTGMPVADVRAFVQAGRGELATHPVRLALLEAQVVAIEQQMAQLRVDLGVLTAKCEDYRGLIARGLDCEDEVGD